MNAAQLPLDGTTYILTTEGIPTGLAPAARKALAGLDPALPLDRARPSSSRFMSSSPD